MIISIDVENTHDKIQLPFMIKNSEETRNGGNIAQQKAYMTSLQTISHEIEEDSQDILVKIRNKTSVSILSNPIHDSTRSLRSSKRQER